VGGGVRTSGHAPLHCYRVCFNGKCVHYEHSVFGPGQGALHSSCAGSGAVRTTMPGEGGREDGEVGRGGGGEQEPHSPWVRPEHLTQPHVGVGRSPTSAVPAKRRPGPNTRTRSKCTTTQACPHTQAQATDERPLRAQQSAPHHGGTWRAYKYAVHCEGVDAVHGQLDASLARRCGSPHKTSMAHTQWQHVRAQFRRLHTHAHAHAYAHAHAHTRTHTHSTSSSRSSSPWVASGPRPTHPPEPPLTPHTALEAASLSLSTQGSPPRPDPDPYPQLMTRASTPPASACAPTVRLASPGAHIPCVCALPDSPPFPQRHYPTPRKNKPILSGDSQRRR
jgi:hypothetical protein